MGLFMLVRVSGCAVLGRMTPARRPRSRSRFASWSRRGDDAWDLGEAVFQPVLFTQGRFQASVALGGTACSSHDPSSTGVLYDCLSFHNSSFVVTVRLGSTPCQRFLFTPNRAWLFTSVTASGFEGAWNEFEDVTQCETEPSSAHELSVSPCSGWVLSSMLHSVSPRSANGHTVDALISV